MEDFQALQDFEKLDINWLPGHMRKALRGVGDQIKRVDVVIELRDARLPITSQNPDLQNLLNNKPSLILFNKSGLADSSQIKKWEKKTREAKAQDTFPIDLPDKSEKN